VAPRRLRPIHASPKSTSRMYEARRPAIEMERLRRRIERMSPDQRRRAMRTLRTRVKEAA
jgi:hypothetical protein